MSDLTTANADPHRDESLARAAEAALRLADEGVWGSSSLRDVARAAQIPLSRLYAAASGKASLVDAVSRRLDEAALAAAEDASPDVMDRLFEAVMARLEAMEPHRFALAAMLREEGPGSVRMGLRLARTSRALLEAAGVTASGRAGTVRLLAMTAVWARIVQVWRDDEGALNRTMAEIDKRLKAMRARLDRIGVGL